MKDRRPFQERVGTKQFAKLSSNCEFVIKQPSAYRRCKRIKRGICTQDGCPRLSHSGKQLLLTEKEG